MTAPEPSPYPPSDVPQPTAGVPPYGAPAGYPAPGYGVPGYGPPPGYGAPGYGAPGYGYGYGYGPNPWLPPAQRPWPYGDGRPGIATSAGVLGIVTGGITALTCVGWLMGTIGGDWSSAALLLTGAPCATGLIAGGIRLLGGHRRGLLLGSALVSIAVLLLTLIIGVLASDSTSTVGILVFVLLALPLPVVTAILAAQKPVQGWTEGLPPY